MKLKNLLHRIPRPVRACICTVLAVVLLLSYYVILDCPVLTMKQHFRRAEKVHLVGPSKIVDVLDEREYGEFVRMYVGESEHGVSFFGKYYNEHPYDDPFAEKLYYFYYTEKTGDITLCVAPNVWGSTWGFVPFERTVPAYLFTEHADAARAELLITVKGILPRENKQFTEHLAAQADRTEEGFFRFHLSAEEADELDALYYLSCCTSGSASSGVAINSRLNGISAVIRLYDVNDHLIAEQQTTIFERE